MSSTQRARQHTFDCGLVVAANALLAPLRVLLYNGFALSGWEGSVRPSLWACLPTLLLVGLSPLHAAPAPIDRMIDVGGYRLHVHVIPGRGTPILFEAGGGDDAGVWTDVAGTVAAITGAPIITYDRAGFGKSETSKSADLADHGIAAGMQGLERALAILGFDRQIVLVGHSYGSFYATMYAARHPDRVRYAVLIDGSSACWFDPAFMTGFRATLPDELARLKARNSMGQYYQSANLSRTVEIMGATAFPARIPVIDLVSDRPPFTDEADVKRWRDCHRQFALAAPNRESITAYGTGHYIYRDNAPLVVEAIAAAYARTAPAAARGAILDRAMRYAVAAANEARKR